MAAAGESSGAQESAETAAPSRPKASNVTTGLVMGPVALAAVAGLVGLTLFCCTNGLGGKGLVVLTISIGAIGLIFGALGVSMAAVRDRYRVLAAVAAVPLALLLGAAAAGTVAGLVSSGVHVFNQYDYGKAYGKPVQATVGDESDCSYTKRSRGGGYSDITCKNATWSVNGKTVTGKLVVRFEGILELRSGKTYPAHALGGTAYADGDGKVHNETFFGRVPWWLVLVGPVLALLSIVGLLALGGSGKPGPATGAGSRDGAEPVAGGTAR